ncbi:TPA: prepilin-type N-terminal cleavage/methylation domain-containing protein [Candidatus Gastranaerophilales bacterium HUM_6]|nr:pilin [Fusobacterium sp. CAG:815]DAA89347.1 MAG TPA: prepilin-type N-terminal cleavage/methylation domain-containing protein [Candidatus Gastranaerophilales bacterium HUM_6]DAA93802.1 MAG TPA: prepilin-type N-terminal cleavage/methylation domain-containing protein [Candidatus Gastranaerophilales bacterium HUM_7]DAB07347.1 MAG TPA: prepilin-type N-terminal cleavage/methylation domain-containing protein [Candidatus Gastranaerophilales bacterium HUM_14]
MKKGFTLSEILITLTIVGVVAALTVPAVMKNYRNKMYTAALQKTYNQLSDATIAIMNDEHVDDFYETRARSCVKSDGNINGDCTEGLTYFLNNYLEPIRKDCGKGGKLCIGGLSSDSYKTLSGKNAGTVGGQYCIQTAKGATICGFFNGGNTCMSLAVDVNGAEGPNVTGRDLFSMDVQNDGTISDYSSGCGHLADKPFVLNNSFGAPATNCSNDNANVIYEKTAGCLTRIIEAGWKMEY